MKSTDTKQLWAIVKLPNLEKEFHCYLLHDSGLRHLELLDTDTLETWDFARPIDFLNWVETQMNYTPNRGGLR